MVMAFLINDISEVESYVLSTSLNATTSASSFLPSYSSSLVYHRRMDEIDKECSRREAYRMKGLRKIFFLPRSALIATDWKSPRKWKRV